MDKVCFQARDTDELIPAAKYLLSISSKRRIIILKGELGAGKTAFVQAFCSLTGIKEQVSSPTFSLINEYRSEEFGMIYHMDFFRLKDEQEAFNIGCEEYFYSGNYCLIEWPDKIMNLLPHDFVKVDIRAERSHRTICIYS